MAEEIASSGVHNPKNSNKPAFQERIKLAIKKLHWQDYGAILITLIVFLIYLNFAGTLHTLPNPVFGGDYYRDRGFVKNIVEGSPVWSDGFYLNEIQYYPYLMFIIQAGVVKATGFSVDQVFIYFPLLMLLLAALIWYKLGEHLFKSKTWGLVNLSALFGISFFYGMKSSDWGLFVFVPLFLYLWLRYEQTEQKKYGLWMGVVLGILALVHGGRFLAAFSLLAISIVIFFLLELPKNPEKLPLSSHIKNLLKKNFLKYYFIFLIGIGIALLFFLPLYLRYQMHSVNLVTVWGDANINKMGLSWAGAIFKSLFFNTSKIILLISSLVSLLGLLFLLLAKKNHEQKWLLTIAAANLIAIQHHLITRPLLGTYFNPGKLELLTYLAPLFFTLGLMVLANSGEKLLKHPASKKTIALAGIFVLLIPAFYVNYQDSQNSQWTKYGQQQNAYVDSLYTMGDWITANVNNDETILSNDESGFMLAVLSGRKVMLTRRTHASYYVDIDQRIADAAVAMYGPNLNLSKQLLQKYKVKYLYVDQYLLSGQMRVRTDLKEYLTKNNVSFSEVYDRYDIALPSEDTNMMNLLLIPPQQFNQEFMKLWEPAYTVSVGGQTAAQLFKLKE